MDSLVSNFGWMAENVSLAILGVVFAQVFLAARGLFFQVFFFILWLLFVPNTIYLITDIQYLPDQWVKSAQLEQSLLLVQYLMLILAGVATFLLGFYPLEKFLARLKIKRFLLNIILVSLNYLIAFGVALGKLQRVESWHIFTEPQKFILGTITLLNLPGVIAEILFFGTISTTLYFSLRRIWRK